MRSFSFKFMSLVACIMIAFSLQTFSQDSASDVAASSEASDDMWYYGKLIKSVSFKGLKNVASKDVDGITSGFIGKQFSDEVFADMIDRIYALDIFDDLVPEAIPGDSKRNTVSIIFTVTERPILSRIIVIGNKQIRSTEIKDAISLKEKEVFVESKVLSDERAIRNFYVEKGFVGVKVSSTIKDTDKGAEVTFNIDEGRSTVISKIAFRGNTIFTDKQIKKVLKMKEAKLLNKGAFKETGLEADKQAVVAFYQGHGYIDATVVDVTREVTVNEEKKRDELTITYVIEEGEQYTYSGIKFIGNEIFSDETLLSLVKVKIGKVFEQTKFQEGLMAIADLYYENGYTSNRFQPVASKDSEAKTVSYVLNIVESSRSHIENLIVRGNSKTQEKVILREVPLEAGDIFSKSKITNGLRNLANLQYFSATVPDIVQGSEEGLVDVVLNVEEQSTTSVEFGVTFSGVADANDLPFALFAKWRDSNLKGTGRSLSVGTSLATKNQSIDLSFGQSWFRDLPISTSLSTSFSHSSLNTVRNAVDGEGYIHNADTTNETYYMEYEQFRWSLGLSGGRRWTPDWAILSLSGGISGSLKCNIYDDNLWVPQDLSVSRYANKWGWVNSIWASYSMDARNISYDASSGWFANERLSWYGLTPWESEFYLRTDTKLEKYFTLLDLKVTEAWNFKAVLFAYTGLSLLIPGGNSGVGKSSQLYIDGMFNGRGWSDIYNQVRGKAMWSNILELRLPVVPGVLAIDGFFDAVAIKDDGADLLSNLELKDFYFSFGPGIRFTLPQFPLRLMFANTFKYDGDSFGFEDTMKFVLSFNMVNR